MPRAFMHSAEVGGPVAPVKTRAAGKPLAGLTAASALLAAAPAALNSVQAVATRTMFRALIKTSPGQGPCGTDRGRGPSNGAQANTPEHSLDCRGLEQHYLLLTGP